MTSEPLLPIAEPTTPDTLSFAPQGDDAPEPVSAQQAAWTNMIQSSLQTLVTEASAIRKHLNDSKTVTKKRYYAKKFAKVQQEVLQMVGALQRMQSTAVPEVLNANSTAPV